VCVGEGEFLIAKFPNDCTCFLDFGSIEGRNTNRQNLCEIQEGQSAMSIIAPEKPTMAFRDHQG